MTHKQRSNKGYSLVNRDRILNSLLRKPFLASKCIVLLLPRSWLETNESCIQTCSFRKGEIFNTAKFLIFLFAKTCHCIISYCFILEAVSKKLALCFIKGTKHLETIKALGLGSHAFITFSVFGTHD